MFYGIGPHVNILCVHNRKAHKLTVLFLVIIFVRLKKTR